MKITKYTQSCLKIEEGGRSLLVDVGTLTTPEFGITEFGNVDAVLFTHSHSDHMDVEFLPKLAATGAVIYGDANVAEKAGDTPVEVIEDDEELVIADFKVKAYAMEHCLMVDGSPAGIPNTGFLINDTLLLPGDSTVDVGVKAETIALPVFGPDISLKDAYGLVVATGASHLIPVHYDVAAMNPQVFAKLSGGALKAELHSLHNGESIVV